MNDSPQAHLQKADRAIRAAKTLLQLQDYDFAVSRAYYAMLYAAKAMLDEKELSFRKHGGVHAAFGEYFVKTGLVDAKYHRWLLDAFDQRLLGDYEVNVFLSREEATQVIEQAEAFVMEACRYLNA